jgi:uncharacterized caspase-like protein
MRIIKLLLLLAFSGSGLIAVKPAYSNDNEIRYLALTIGNSNYKDGYLSGPENDAGDMAKSLSNAGFDVLGGHGFVNLKRSEMKSILLKFMALIDRNSFVVIYYSGHGIEVEYKNYLVPVDADASSEDMEDSNLSLNWITERLAAREARTKIIILDACRNLPSALRYKSLVAVGGLSDMMQLGPGLRIIYAASPKQVAFAAAPGERNSVFTAALLTALSRKGESFNSVLQTAAELTLERTKNKQQPYSAGALGMAARLPKPISMTLPGGSPSENVRTIPQSTRTPESCSEVSQMITSNGITSWSRKCI